MQRHPFKVLGMRASRMNVMAFVDVVRFLEVFVLYRVGRTTNDGVDIFFVNSGTHLVSRSDVLVEVVCCGDTLYDPVYIY